MSDVMKTEYEPESWYHCPDCGCVVGYDDLAEGKRAIPCGDYQIPFNYCPKCGWKVFE